MYPPEVKLNTNPVTRDRTNLTLLVLVLGILSLISAGIVVLSVLRQLYPEAFSAINKQLNYQGKLQNAAGITVPDGDKDMKFSIYDAASGGTRLWTECGTLVTPTARTVTISNGVFSVMLGDTNSNACPGGTDSNAIDLDFNSDEYWMGLTVEADSEMTPRKRIGSAGYAFNADLLDGLDTDTTGGAGCLTPGACAYVPVTASSGNFILDVDTLYLDAANDRIGINDSTPSYTLDITSAESRAVNAVTSAAGGYGVYGAATDTSATINYGGYFTAAGTGVVPPLGFTAGVYGEATSTAAIMNMGGYFVSRGTGTNASGVVGLASATGAVQNFGGIFMAQGDTGRGVYGSALGATATTKYGVMGESQGTGVGSAGVRGRVNGAASDIYGVLGEAGSSANVINYGGYFTTNGQQGRAVYGRAISGPGTGLADYGGYFEANSDLGRGVYGEASGGGAVTNYGGYFLAKGASGHGVYGEANAAGGPTANYGGYFTAAGGSGYGVYGSETSATGTTYGFYGDVTSDDGWAGYFNGGKGVYISDNLEVDGHGAIGASSTYSDRIMLNIDETFTGGPINSEPITYYGIYNNTVNEVNPGVCGSPPKTHPCAMSYYGQYNNITTNSSYGFSDLTGIYDEVELFNSNTANSLRGLWINVAQNSDTGTVSEASGIYASVSEGGLGGTISTAYGGYFSASNADGQNYGVYAYSQGDFSSTFNAYGLYGNATGATSANYGVMGVASWTNSYGVWGESNGASGYGVYGVATDMTGANTGGSFNSYGPGGSGVRGYAAGTGTTYGVYGSVASATGWAGYFTGGQGLYANIGVIGSPTAPGGGYSTGMLNAQQLCIEGDCKSAWPAGGSPGGLDSYVQYNNGGAFGGDSNFIWDDTNDWLGVGTAPSYPLHVYTATYLNAIVSNNATSGGYAITGGASATGAGTNYGGYFTAAQDSGVGVLGANWQSGAISSAGGQFYAYGDWSTGAYGYSPYNGVSGSASGNSGRGVVGSAFSGTPASAMNYGGYFSANGDLTGSVGVYGEASGAGTVYAVQGYATNSTGVTNYGGHFTALGTGLGTSGVYGSVSGAVDNIYGVQGVATSTANVTNYGGFFYAQGETGRGVYGEANNTGAVTNYGGYFSAAGAGSYAAGVYGTATGAGSVVGVHGFTYNDGNYMSFGGLFESSGDRGRGVYGEAKSTDAQTNYGGYFLARGSADDTAGAYGLAADATGAKTYGGHFVSWGTGTGSSGVYGQATETSAVTNYGGYFTAAGTSNASGVYAEATGEGLVAGVTGLASGNDAGTANIGGYFEADGGHSWSRAVVGYLPNSDGGRAVFGHAANSSATLATYGGYFRADGAISVGVYGYAPYSAGSYINYGGYFSASGLAGRGIYAEATNPGAGYTFGGDFAAYGTGSAAAGVRGIAYGSGSGVSGVTGLALDDGNVVSYGGYFISEADQGRGVYGDAAETGSVTNYGGLFYARGDTGYAVLGSALATTGAANYGGYFVAGGDSGAYGVYASAYAGSGVNYGVYSSVSSASAYSGWFTGGVGVYIGTALGINDSTPTEATLVVGNAGAGNIYATFATAGTERLCWDGSGASLINDCTGSPGDYAEEYGTTDVSLEAGDIVVSDPAHPAVTVITDGVPGSKAWVLKSGAAYQENIVGVVSTFPNETIGQNFDPSENPRPVALNGRVPVKVNDEGGVILSGDPITSSSVAGVGMKATKPGRIIGYALSDWSGPGQGAIVALILPNWSSASTIGLDGTTALFNDNFAFNKTGTADAVVQGYNSYGLTLRGSGWDGAAAVDRDMKLINTVTDADNYKLSILNNAGAEVAYIGQDGAMGVSGKFYPASPTGFQSTAYIFYGANYMRTNADGWSTGSFDFAEMFKSNEDLEPGDIVSVDGETNEYVKKSIGTYDPMVLGIVSTKPGFLAGMSVNFDEPLEDPGYPVALAGRVPTKVSTENGPIVPGDPLTSSSTPGVAMKATEPGMVIGVALEGWDNPGVGNIKVFVNLSWFGVNGSLTPATELASLDLTGNLNMNGNYILNVAQIVGKDEKWSIDENGILKIKLVSEDDTEKEMFGLSSAKVELTLSGTDRLENGQKLIDLTLIDPEFVKNVSSETPFKIFITPAEEMNGVYITERTEYSFRVKELNSGTSNAAFDWLVIARRKGYEDPAPETPTPPEEPTPPTEPAPETPPAEEPEVPSEPAPETPPAEEPSAPEEPTPPTEPAPETPPAEPTP